MFSQFTKLFLLFALLLLIWNDSVSCFLSCRYKHFNYASNTSEIMPANACSSMFVHGGHLMNISGKYVNIMQSLSPVSAFFRNYSLYPFFILKAKNKLQANSAKIQDKSPKSTGIIWDLHQSVQEKKCPWQEELICRAQRAQGKSRSEVGSQLGPRSWDGSVPPAQPWGLLLMSKGSRLCSQHPLPQENTATENFPAKLHENKTINKHEILWCKAGLTFFLQSGYKVTSAMNSDFIAVHLSPSPEQPS